MNGCSCDRDVIKKNAWRRSETMKIVDSESHPGGGYIPLSYDLPLSGIFMAVEMFYTTRAVSVSLYWYENENALDAVIYCNAFKPSSLA